MINKKVALSGISIALALAGGAAHASLVFLGTTDLQGTGIGGVNTVLTIQSPGDQTTEDGSVGLNSSGVQVVTGGALVSTTPSTLQTPT